MTFAKARISLSLILLAIIGFGAAAGFGLGSFCYLHIGMIRLFCPVGFLEICISNQKIYWDLLFPFLSVFIFIFILGRVFCSWICPVSVLNDKGDAILNKLLPRNINNIRKKLVLFLNRNSPNLNYKDGIAVLIGAGAAIAIFEYPFISTFCPIGVITRNVINIASHQQITGDLIFVVLAIFLGFFFSFGWRGCCPVGMIRGLGAGTNLLLYPKLDSKKCNRCDKCETVCPVNFCLYKNKYDVKICSKCFECIDNCPQKALSISILK